MKKGISVLLVLLVIASLTACSSVRTYRVKYPVDEIKTAGEEMVETIDKYLDEKITYSEMKNKAFSLFFKIGTSPFDYDSVDQQPEYDVMLELSSLVLSERLSDNEVKICRDFIAANVGKKPIGIVDNDVLITDDADVLSKYRISEQIGMRHLFTHESEFRTDIFATFDKANGYDARNVKNFLYDAVKKLKKNAVPVFSVDAQLEYYGQYVGEIVVTVENGSTTWSCNICGEDIELIGNDDEIFGKIAKIAEYQVKR